MHDHTTQDAVLGHAILENRDEGVYAYCTFNNTEAGKTAKELVHNGDVRALSIYANKLVQNGKDVVHGCIRELSLVIAGANPGAYIDFVMAHGEEEEDALYACWDENALMLYHADKEQPEEKKEPEKRRKMSNGRKNDDKTVQDVINSMTEEQKTVMYALIAEAMKASKENNDEEEGEKEMKHNVFDYDNKNEENTLIHAAMDTIIKDAKRCGSMKESFLAHADEYGITNIDYLFPEAKTLTNTPEFIKRDMDWVQKVMNNVHHTPFSRIKSMFADITEDEARAKGYIKGKLKKEEVFSLLKRTTTPTTVYKKQKMDRDDVIDITDMDVIAWLKSEMRMMLDEEIARAILIGDGRLASSDDHINTSNIRPIAFDDALYTIQAPVKVAANASAEEKAKTFINTVIKSRKDYKGSGNPILFTTEDVITDILLLEDGIGHKLYKSVADIATTLRVSEIVTVEVMEGQKGKNGGELLGVIVNLKDYNVGADKGGAVNMFDDFDIDYNQQKYLIETRCSGALVKPFSAIALEVEEVAAQIAG